jgi:hypothetical protein
MARLYRGRVASIGRLLLSANTRTRPAHPLLPKHSNQKNCLTLAGPGLGGSSVLPALGRIQSVPSTGRAWGRDPNAQDGGNRKTVAW